MGNNERKLEAMRSDLARSEKILAAGGFTDADGDWHECDRSRREAEIESLRARIATTEAKITK